VCVVGDALLDIDWEGDVHRVCSDAPAPVLDTPTELTRPGGAALAACLAARAGARITLITALSSDAEGRRLAGLLNDHGIAVVDLGLDGPTPVKLRLRSEGQSIARVDRSCTPVVAPGPWTPAAAAAVGAADALLVADYGRGLAGLPEVATAVASTARPTVWDPHPGGPPPPPTVALATPNLAEARLVTGDPGPRPDRLPDVVRLAADAADRLGCPTAVTAGPLGAVLVTGGRAPAVVPATPARGDACGAGDRFSSSAAVALARGLPVLAAVEQAIADAGTFVAGGGAPTALRDSVPAGGAVVPLDERRMADPVGAALSVRQAGGIVVAAGGCFDVLHAGHVQLLEGARRLGDHLVVCLNSDESVRLLKGPGRPLNDAADRATVLASLACVDGVVIFGEDTPGRALASFRPHLFVKGADYQGADLEEAAVLAGWGGQIVLLPLMAERSTTRIITTAARVAG
jgi:rfaE bifunctional protein nucleotidyltransferase chain/domain